MDSPVRGILKNSSTSGGHQVVDDDSYLFCNVPEHHDLVSVRGCFRGGKGLNRTETCLLCY